MEGGPHGFYRSGEDKSSANLVIVIIVVTIVFILLGMFSFTSTPQGDNGLPDGVDKYGRSTNVHTQPQ